MGTELCDALVQTLDVDEQFTLSALVFDDRRHDFVEHFTIL